MTSKATPSIGVLGLGSIGMRHAGNLIAAGVDVRGFDPSPARRAVLSEKGGTAFDNADDAMEDMQGVVIATPSGGHLNDLAAAVAAGKHVFIEKPLAHVTEGVEEILCAAEQKGLIVFAGLNMRFHPAVAGAKALLDQDALGDLLWGRLLAASYLPDWRPDQDYRRGYAADAETGGALFDFIHEFDLAVHLLGPAVTCAAQARRTGQLEMDSEDCADVMLAHENGARSTLHVDYVTRPRQRLVEIGGSGGVLRLDLEAGRLVAMDTNGGVIEDRTCAPDTNIMYVDEMANFLGCIINDSAPACNGRDALDVLRLVVEARRLAGLPSVGGPLASGLLA